MTRMLFKNISVTLLVLWTCRGVASAQDKQLLTEETFVQQVKQYHPVVKQGDLLTQKAEADLLTARGAFDPVLDAATSAKTLDGVDYYQYTNPELKIPTGTPINLKAGYEKSNGQYINPERTKGVASYIGIEIPLLNGLLTDKKRTALRQAGIYRQLNTQERLLMINDLLFDARSAYWEWAGAWYLYRVYTNYIEIADKRTMLISLSFKHGDRAMADTMEARAQLQNIKLMQAGALAELNKKIVDLSAFLWTADETPYLLPESFVPDTLALATIQPLPDTAVLVAGVGNAHPAVQAARYKLGILEAERKLKRQNFLPVVNLQANLLSKDYYQYKNVSWPYLENNYKLGFNVKLPLLWRQERGEYKNVLIKIRDNNLELQKKQWDLQNKIRKYYTETVQLQHQLQAAREMNSAYTFLLKNEELKFTQGESSLFLINARENKILEIQQKVIELQVKYRKATYAIQWAAGSPAAQ
ncbi:TolC family protein [Paraflavitalea soli]|nr:TolC family protein [Paraflavitalea soli]